MFRRVVLLAGLALSQGGCAEQLHLLDRGPTGGVSPCSFWPPPPSSATWIVETSGTAEDESLSAVARRLELSLQGGGYSDQRWYPIGIGSNHGFAVTTRLEQVADNANRESSGRWSSLYPDAANLRWLMQARTPVLPRPGRYRVFLVSYTDLPIGPTTSAPTWNEETVMEWPDAAPSSSSRESAVPQRPAAGYRFGIYEYAYEWDDLEARGRLRPVGVAASENRQSLPVPLPFNARR